MSKNAISPEPNWDDPAQVGDYIAGLLDAYPMAFYEDRPPYYSPLKSEDRFDRDLALAARAEGLTDDEIAALLRQCHSTDERDALDAYRDTFSGRWKVCPAVIPHWSTRPQNYEPRLWLPEWAELHRQGLPFR